MGTPAAFITRSGSPGKRWAMRQTCQRIGRKIDYLVTVKLAELVAVPPAVVTLMGAVFAFLGTMGLVIQPPGVVTRIGLLVASTVPRDRKNGTTRGSVRERDFA